MSTFWKGFEKRASSAAYDQFESWAQSNGHGHKLQALYRQKPTPQTAKVADKIYQLWLKKDPEAKALQADKRFAW